MRILVDVPTACVLLSDTFPHVFPDPLLYHHCLTACITDFLPTLLS